MAANQTFDPDATVDDETTVVLESGDAVDTADFGYNWSVDPLLGAIGDRIWIDADGDGIQDAGEAGLSNVTVVLFSDPDGDGVFDVPVATNVTDDAGMYIFDDLAPDAYVVVVTPPAGYSQTGDPDGTLDNQSTLPVVLAPGDVVVIQDYGYQPVGASSDIGDTIYFDTDADGVEDPADPGIPGVTVALFHDNNGNGVVDSNDVIVASTVTDTNGMYLFPGLPADDYIVWVNDTADILGGTVPTGDPDGGGDSQSAVTTDGATDNLVQDFGYTENSAGTGVIGDTVFLDQDMDGIFDPGEGLAGVSVELYSNGVLVAVDVTDVNGSYYFGGLSAGTYTVQVDTATLPPGVNNTVDPDGGNDSLSTVGLPAGGIDLAQDFGYEPVIPNTIAGTLWEDQNADGTLDPSESNRFAGVTVVLTDTNGHVVGTTLTDANGDYSFTGLPDGTYVVDVSDDYQVLNGHWHSDGPNDGADNNSQDDPYVVSVAGGATDTTGDFGYYIDPSLIGNFIWIDVDGDGIQNGGDPALSNAVVTLAITYPNGTTVSVAQVTGPSGLYQFANLLDEAFNGAGTNEPTFVISVVPPVGFIPTLVNQSVEAQDSDVSSGEPAMPVQGGIDLTYDFGFLGSPGYLLTKSLVSPTNRPAQPLEAVQFEIMICNTGGTEMTSIPLTDTYDDLTLDFQSASVAPDIIVPGMLTWSNVGPLAVGVCLTVTVNFAVDASPGCAVPTNVAVASPPFPFNVQTGEAPYEVAQPSFSLNKRLVMVASNGVFTYEVAITNTGCAALNSVSVTDTFDTVYGFVTSTPPAGVAGNMLTWSNVGPIAPSGVVTITYDLIGTAALGTNTCSAGGSGVTNLVCANAAVTNGSPLLGACVNEAICPDYEVTKVLLTPTNGVAGPGQTLSFLIAVTNTGDVLIPVPLQVQDVFDDAVLTFANAVPAASSNVGGVVFWDNIGPLAVGAVTNIMVNFTANTNAGCGVYTNVAVVTPPLPWNVMTGAAPYEVVQPDVDITKTYLGVTGTGDVLQYSIAITNTGCATLNTLNITDVYDNVFTFQSSVPPADVVGPGNVLGWNTLGPLAPGASQIITVNLQATMPVGTNSAVVNSVCVDAQATNGTPTVNDCDTVLLDPGLELTKMLIVPSNRAAQVGEQLTFEITLTNTGDIDIVSLPLVDTYDPSFITFSNAVPAPDVVAPGMLSWTNVGPLPVGSAVTVTVSYTATSNTLGIARTNRAVACPPLPLNCETSDAPYRIGSVVFSVDKSLVQIDGDLITFNIAITNSGSVDLVMVSATDTFDSAFMTFQSAVPPADTNGVGFVVWNDVGPLMSGAATNIVVVMQALQPFSGRPETNCVAVGATTPSNEPPAFPQSDCAEVIPGYRIVKALFSPPGRPAQEGETVSFNILVSNTGNVDMLTVPLEDIFDEATLSFNNAVPAADSNGAGLVSWTNIGPLAVGMSTMVVVNFTVDANPGCQSPTNVAQVPLNAPFDVLSDDAPYDVAEPDVDVLKNFVGVTGTGDVFQYQIVITNSGCASLSSLSVTDVFDSVFSYVGSIPPADTVGPGSQIVWSNVGPLAAGSATTLDCESAGCLSFGAPTSWPTIQYA